MTSNIPAAAKTDEDIREDVLCAIAWDDRLAGLQVGVQVEHGVVTLGGVVNDWVQFNAAAEAAHRVAAVRDVANELQVRGEGVDTPADPDLAVAVRRALRWDARIPEGDIRSTISGGVVTLEGVVGSPAQKAEAARVVGRLHGVRRVDNRLHVAERS
jgi:osmotically-inducible protein OsmY